MVALTDEALQKAIKQLREMNTPMDDSFFIFPTSERVISNRYRGIGRPRSIDYDYVEIDWNKRLGLTDLKK